ncbi:MAG: ABC transporter substrate-binding protein [Hyphomicrobiaceae bacterium]|nr:ABC transporter substrate-binding protein [Hyphomicrobiaceae bacterium]
MTLLNRRHFMQGAVAVPLVLNTDFAFAQASADKRPPLVVAVAGLPATLEPARELSNVGTRVTYSMFDTLIRRDFLGTPDGGGSELKPHLATSWERKSPKELIVTLRPGVKFHNGDEMTADDVVYTFRDGRLRGAKPEIPEGRAYFGTLDTVEAIDKYTVRFTTKAPDVLLEQRLASWASWIVNKRHYESVGIDGFSRAPVGTGPYKLARMVANDFIALDAFDDYWMGKPSARSVTFRAIPELAARVAGLISGEYDLITNIPPDQISLLEGQKDVEARSVVLANVHLLTFDELGPLTKDKRIRQALSLSIDRRKLVDTLWLGKAVIPDSHNYPEYGQMFLEGRKIAFDPAKARALLKEAGYAGEPVVYRTMPNYYTNALDAAQIIVEMWKEVGINASVQVVENFNQMRAAGQQVGNNSNSTRLPDPLGALWVSWGPDSEFQKKKNWTTTTAFNEAGRALEAETDPAKRKELFKTMLDAWDDEAPGAILYRPLEIYGVKKSVKWRPTTFYFMDLRPDNLRFDQLP